MQEEIEKHIAQVQVRIDRLRASLPAHSTPPSMLIQLEDLEEELEQLQQKKNEHLNPE